WLPPYHDMGLIGSVLAPLSCGGSLVSMSPLHFLQRPARWLRAITKYRAHISGGPNFAFDLCVRKVDLDRETLDLSSWEVAYNGAEVVRPSTLAAFAAKFAAVGFQKRALFPCYGLAEATLLATSVARGAGATTRMLDGAERVSCGRPARGVEASIEGGEIVLAGPSISRGYWGHEPFLVPLRTGDLGAVVDGELYITGRCKDLIIFSGRKLFPDDLEQVAASAHPSLRPTVAAFGVDLEGERLVLVHEVDRVDDAARTAITRAIVESFDIAPYAIELVPAGTIPKTSSGKVQRHACKEAWLAGEMRGE
ncbi:MAG: AMP-binding protein, partial [Deltaproteobacteria bacterium]|nr:AMP-binding protein [Deltaproteobacteria bacterium]